MMNLLGVCFVILFSHILQPGDENELRGGFRGMPRPQALKRRNRSVSESYSMDVRQQSNSDRQSAQHQKRVRRLSGGSNRRRADSMGPSCPDTSARSSSFDSERVNAESAEPSSSSPNQCSSKDSSHGTSSKARVYFDLGESSNSNTSRTKSNSPDQTDRETREGSCSSLTKSINKKKESAFSKSSVDKQKKVGESSKIIAVKDDDVASPASKS